MAQTQREIGFSSAQIKSRKTRLMEMLTNQSTEFLAQRPTEKQLLRVLLRKSADLTLFITHNKGLQVGFLLWGVDGKWKRDEEQLSPA